MDRGGRTVDDLNRLSSPFPVVPGVAITEPESRKILQVDTRNAVRRGTGGGQDAPAGPAP